MKVPRTVAELRRAIAQARQEGGLVALVPTMGAFHAGHLALMRRARTECSTVVVSIFVNPTQFGKGEDLEAYPLDLERDTRLASEVGVDILFTPSVEEMYPAGFATSVEVAGVSETLCGAPGRRGREHFRGVATVVAKLLNMCRPDVAYFGAKDYQQVLVVKRLVKDLDVPVRIEVCETVRDEDGLALSSRNAYLSELERRRALSLKRALDTAAGAIAAGATRPHEVVAAAMEELAAPGIEVEYVEVVSADDLSPLDRISGEDVLVAVAARVGGARLIDNTVVSRRRMGRPVASAARATG